MLQPPQGWLGGCGAAGTLPISIPSPVQGSALHLEGQPAALLESLDPSWATPHRVLTSEHTLSLCAHHDQAGTARASWRRRRPEDRTRPGSAQPVGSPRPWGQRPSSHRPRTQSRVKDMPVEALRLAGRDWTLRGSLSSPEWTEGKGGKGRSSGSSGSPRSPQMPGHPGCPGAPVDITRRPQRWDRAGREREDLSAGGTAAPGPALRAPQRQQGTSDAEPEKG
ncbi:collagen alpha-1(III) chain-like [Lemur catta]|uniref:collagen alpha-1(III) chain-like n=1 Tax=Lemur catta TaxID=9447 RepID=UPI001E26C494|nr:collagen alpha-1(III) chain-like [Lemur catta]